MSRHRVSLSANSVGATKRTVKVNGQNKTVNLVMVDLNDTKIGIDVIISNNKIGGNEGFANMIKRKKPLAAINANYFDA